MMQYLTPHKRQYIFLFSGRFISVLQNHESVAERAMETSTGMGEWEEGRGGNGQTQGCSRHHLLCQAG